MAPSATRGVREGAGNLPADVTSFVGRRRQISDAKRFLSASRLLTLTGPGGVGKTRLALRVADTMRRASFKDGVWFVELAELRDPALLGHTVMEKLGLHDQASRAAVDTIIDHLRSRTALLVLDNCEHLIDDCALLVDTLIRACPQVSILATSRQSLNLYGEAILLVPPLPAPDPEQTFSPDALAQYDAVQMFADRATAVLPDFDLRSQDCAVLAHLCHTLDGIPLAIELAAVWLRALSLEQINERLAERFRLLTRGSRSAPTRQRTLRALIDWSYDLCAETEQRIWARASVFSGSFDLAAIEYVGSGDGMTEVPDVVRSLVDKSVLIREEHGGSVRYRMLETTREYGQERLMAAGEYTAVRRRHRDWYAGLVEQFKAEWLGPDQETWVSRLRQEHSNLRVALDFCVTEPGEAVTGLRMATIDHYWTIRGFHTEARHWLDQALAAAPEPTRERASALRLGGWQSILQGGGKVGMSLLTEAAELAERIGFEAESAWVTHVRGMAALFTGDLEKAEVLLSDAVLRHRAVQEADGEHFALFMLGLTLGAKGERERGLALLEKSVALSSQYGESYWRAWSLWGVSYVEVLRDKLERADDAVKEALRIHGRMDSRHGIAFMIDTLAWVNERQGRHIRAATLFGIAAAVWHEIGASADNYDFFAPYHQEHAARVRAAIGDDRYEAAFHRGYQLPGHKGLGYALETKTLAREAPRTSDEKTPLTPRERQIAEQIAAGLSNKDIAERLFIAPRTAEAHVQHILTKLGFTSRAQVAAWFAAQQSSPAADA